MPLVQECEEWLLANQPYLSAQVEIRQASSRLTTLDSLGSYRVLIQPDPST